MPTRSANILIVDDSAADRTSLRLAFERTQLPLKLHFAPSSRAALEMLSPPRGEGEALRPQLMVVDLKMPGMSGLDFLRAVKSDPGLLPIPVVLYSGSDEQSDIFNAYSGFAIGYIVKPVDAGRLGEVAEVLGRLCTRVLSYPDK